MSTPGDKHESFERAVAEEAAARAILLDRDAWDALAITHLLEAWNALLDPNHNHGQKPLSTRLASLNHPYLNAKRLEQLAKDLAIFEKKNTSANDLDRQLLCNNRALLYACINHTRGQALQWVKRGGVFFGITLLITVFIWLLQGPTLQIQGGHKQHGWIGQYYPQANFGGSALIRHDAKVEFDWHDRAPQTGFPRDRFSIQWDSCLALETAQEILFQIGSDDGSRVFLNGRQVIDNWRDQGGAWESYRTRLEPGVHHIRVQYYENLGFAFVVFNLSGVQQDLPQHRLLTPVIDDKRIHCLIR